MGFNAPLRNSATQTNPAANLTCTLDAKGRSVVTIHAESIADAQTVLIQASEDATTYFDVEELTTALLNTKYIVTVAYSNAWRHWKVTLEESTGTGTQYIYMGASAY